MTKSPSIFSREFNVVCIAIIVLFAARTLYFLIQGSPNYLFFVTDDFFYYLLPAKHFVSTGRFSFDGMTITNGFHPLWMLVITAVWICSFGSDQLFFVLLTVVLSLLAFWTYRLFRGLIATLDIDSALSPAIIGISLLGSVGLIFIGMEAALALPLYCYLLIFVSQYDGSSRATTKIGIVSCVLVLARLDMALLIAPIALIVGLRKSWRASIRSLALFSLMLMPLLIYAAINYYYFGTVVTGSSIVKQLHDDSFHFNNRLIAALLLNRDGLGAFFLIPVALFFLRRFADEHSWQQVAVVLIGIGFPVVFYLVFGLRSDWVLFRWYYFPIPILFLIASAIIARYSIPLHSQRVSRLVVLTSSLGLLLFSMVDFYDHTIAFKPESNSVFQHAVLLRPFVASHSGRYAMGDRAGLTAYILDVPMLQLEGLASDMRMVDSIRNNGELLPILQQHDIDYLIESSGTQMPRDNGCYLITTPHAAVAGAHTLAMHAKLCSEPVYHVATSNDRWDTTNTRTGLVNTYVFKLR